PVHGRALMLRDTEGIAPSPVVVPIEMARVVTRFDGTRTAEALADELGGAATPKVISRLAAELDAALFLDSPAFRARPRDVVHAFGASRARPAAHAGGAYHADAKRLARFIDDDCLAHALPKKRPGHVTALAAPHMDLWRAAVGYGHAYRAFA